VEKDLLKKVLESYPSCSVEEAKELHLLCEAYPYSQLLHVLSARASKAHDLSDQQNGLQLAAVYSADRSVLKWMMSSNGEPAESRPETPVNNAHPPTSITQPENAINSDKRGFSSESTESTEDSGDLAARVIRDVTQLYNTRHNFEMMFVDTPLAALPKTVEDLGKSRRERIIELSKALNSQAVPEPEEIKPMKKRREARKEIIDEIADTKNSIEPANDKQKEQLQIIDHFIKVQPSISNAKDKPAHIKEGDLSTIKTGEFGDNIVSETLVELLLKQGKKDKAIEVLKKLIWKFPQKKAYFAAQIEELKK
jgi:hypothetical protein